MMPNYYWSHLSFSSPNEAYIQALQSVKTADAPEGDQICCKRGEKGGKKRGKGWERWEDALCEDVHLTGSWRLIHQIFRHFQETPLSHQSYPDGPVCSWWVRLSVSLANSTFLEPPRRSFPAQTNCSPSRVKSCWEQGKTGYCLAPQKTRAWRERSPLPVAKGVKRVQKML